MENFNSLDSYLLSPTSFIDTEQIFPISDCSSSSSSSSLNLNHSNYFQNLNQTSTISTHSECIQNNYQTQDNSQFYYNSPSNITHQFLDPNCLYDNQNGLNCTKNDQLSSISNDSWHDANCYGQQAYVPSYTASYNDFNFDSTLNDSYDLNNNKNNNYVPFMMNAAGQHFDSATADKSAREKETFKLIEIIPVKKPRTKYTKSQVNFAYNGFFLTSDVINYHFCFFFIKVDVLESSFSQNPYPNYATIDQLCRTLAINKDKISVRLRNNIRVFVPYEIA
jgi:hypothetical protein